MKSYATLLAKLFTLSALLLLSAFANAETYFTDISYSLLRGTQYEVGDSQRKVGTLEFVSAGSWGDVFFFHDHLRFDNGQTDDYWELQPRFKLASFTESGSVKQLYVATQWEHSEFQDNFLIGPGADLDIPGFQFFQINAYYRENQDADNNFQITSVWAAPFEIGSTQWLFDGFFDWASSSDNAAANLNFTPQIKWNMGKKLNLSNPLYLGLEYTYWNNKFGIKGVTENNLNVLLKYHF
jgi:nucleoside-specific outer membrane channel protein Tsx